MVPSDDIFSDYFPPIVSIPQPDYRITSHIANRKLPPIVGPKSDTADYRRLPPISIFFPRRKFSHCPIYHPIFYPILRSVGQWDAGLRIHIHTTLYNSLYMCMLFTLCSCVDQQASADGIKDTDGSPLDIKSKMDSWVLQVGFPKISVTRNANGTVSFSQYIYLQNPNEAISSPSPFK